MGEMSILYLTLYGARVGGGEVQYEYLIKGLDRNRFCPIVICPSKGDLVESLLSEGIPTHVLKLPRWLHVQSVLTKRIAVQRIVRFAKKAGVDLFFGGYPITPASDILKYLANYKHFGIKTFQAEDEIAAITSALGAAFVGNLSVTASSGPGIALKG